MRSFKLVPNLYLAPLAAATSNHEAGADVLIGQRSNVSLFNVVVRRKSTREFAARVRNEFDLAPPTMPKYAKNGPIAFVWAGVGQWMVVGDGVDASSLEKRLRASLSDAASIVDLSDGRTIIRIGGPGARDVLAKGVLLDLHPSAFQVGDVALTTVAHMNVHFWQVDGAPTYDFAVFRSFANAFCEWIFEAAAEFGPKGIHL